MLSIIAWHFCFCGHLFWYRKLFMEKYGDIIMNQRIVANKHVRREMDVNASMFKSLGQLIISNEPDHEGIFVINSNGEVISVATNTASGSTVIDETIKRWLRENYLSSGNTVEFVNQVADAINQRIDGLEDRVDEQFSGVTESINGLDERVRALEVSGTPTPIDEETVRRIADEEISKFITSAGTIMVSDHVFCSKEQYNTLVASGSAYIDGKYIVYSDNIYYCIYEGEIPPTPSGSTSGSSYDYDERTGMLTFDSGTTVDEEAGLINLEGVTIDDDGIIDMGYIPTPTPSGGDIDFDDDTDTPEVNAAITDGGLMYFRQYRQK